MLANPNGEPSSRKGMVVGNVQSGKTSHYIGLISKAADAGYGSNCNYRHVGGSKKTNSG